MAAALICDIGGTNARFALAGQDGLPNETQVFPVADYPFFAEALAAYLAVTGIAPTSAAIAAAGPVVEGSIRMTNAPWTIRAAEVSDLLGGAEVELFNDLEAVAFALPHLRAEEVETLRPGAPPSAPLPKLALNVGTGFGAAVAVPSAGGWVALATEAGHMHLDTRGLTENGMTVEDMFSGPGYRRYLPANAADLVERRAKYSWLFGHVVRDMVLATGTWGGVHLCGGVLADFTDNLTTNSFLDGFLAGGPMAPRLHAVPVGLITLAAPALRGLAARSAG